VFGIASARDFAPWPNQFHPEVVARAVELLRTGATDLRTVIRREYPVLTRLGIERVIGLAREEIVERNRHGRAA
jgi:hypothetical protein